MLLFSSVLGRALTHHDTRVSVRYVFTRPKKWRFAKPHSPVCGRGRGYSAGLRWRAKGNGTWGELCLSDRHQQSGDWLPKAAWAIRWFGTHQSWEGDGMEIRGKTVWEGFGVRLGEQCPIAPLPVAWGSVSSTYHSRVELWSGFLATEK